MNPRGPWRAFLMLAAVTASSSAAGCSGGSAAPVDEAGSACMPIDPPTICPSPPPSYKNEIQFLVADFCAGAKCHSPGGAESVHDFTTRQGIYDDRLTFAQQLTLCPSSSSGMPPLGYPQPTTAQRSALIAWAAVCGSPDN
jgi:hypothetical protein